MILKKYSNKIFLIILIYSGCIIFNGSFLFSQANDNLLISDIISNIQKYKKKRITLNLKLKFVDRVFEKIVFYDKKNRDIEFDISLKETKNKLKRDMLNLHEGMDYYVTFTVRNVGNLGGLIADLHEFKPVILKKIP